MFANREEALAQAGSLFRAAETGIRPFLLDEKGFWLAPAPPEGAEGVALRDDLKQARPGIAGWLRTARENDSILLPFGNRQVRLTAVRVSGENKLLGFALPQAAPENEAVWAALLDHIEGIAFSTDGVQARSRGTLGSIGGSEWLPEGWHELWARLLLLSMGADSAYTAALHQAVQLPMYSLALCRYVQVSAGPAAGGVAGWFRLQSELKGKEDVQPLLLFFTYVGNPAAQLPAGPASPDGVALGAHLAGPARRDWAYYLAEVGRSGKTANFEAEFASGQALFTVEVRSELVYGPRGTLVGHHHVAYLKPDPVFEIPATTPASNDTSAGAKASVLAKEADHRIKNSLSLAAGLLQLQSYSIEDPAAKEALTDSVQRLYTVADLHEALYRYTSDDTQKVQAKPFLETVAERLRSLVVPQGIEIRTEIEEIDLPGKTASRIALLINELVLNAAKYAFPDQRQGFIAIYFARTKNGLYLSVQDNGQGMEARNPAQDSLGNTLIAEFTQELGAQMRLETQAGTRYVFTFSV